MPLSRLRPNSLRSAAVGLVAAAATLVAAPAVRAQIFTGGDANPAVAMPATPVPASVPVQVVAPHPAAPELRFLPSTLDGLRLTGETGDLRWPVYLTAAQARETTRFRLGYLSAISVLPDSSLIEVRINDRKIGSDVIDSSGGLRTVEFGIPGDVLQAGYNSISLSLQQRHRVDCSVAATYELWTKIDPTETGLVLAGDMRGVTGIGDLAALLPRSDGTMPIHIVLSGKTNPPHLQRLILAAQDIALAGHVLQPAVDFAVPAADIHGVNLALGTRAALAHLPQLADSLGTGGPFLGLVPAPPAGRPTVVVTGSTDDEVDQAIALLGQAADPHGSTQGLEAIAHYPAWATTGGTSIALRDLGIRSQDFDGRFFRKSVNLKLPPDFLAANYGRGTLDLAGGYAAGLVRGSQVRVDVNGRSAGIIKLPYADGDVFQHNQLFLPLGMMRPGLNRVDIIAETPRPEDAVCAAGSGRRFLLLETSELSLPVLAHIQRLPDLALTTAGALPYDRGTPHLVVPKPDRETMAAALSLTTRAAVTAGHPIAFRFSTTTDAVDDGSTLIVSPARQLDPSLMSAIGLDPANLQAAWQSADAMPAPPPPADSGPALPGRWWMTGTDGPAACRLPAQLHAEAADPMRHRVASPVAAPTPDSDDLLDVWNTSGRAALSWRERLMTSLSHTVHWARHLIDAIHMPSFQTASTDGVTIDTSLVLAQGMTPGSDSNVTTIVTAPDATTLRAAMTCLFDPQVWSQVRGRLATIDAADGDVTTTAATSFHYVTSERSSLGNSRLVIAGWFSLNPLAFAAAALLTALCLSGTTLWFVRNIGRRPE